MLELKFKAKVDKEYKYLLVDENSPFIAGNIECKYYCKQDKIIFSMDSSEIEIALDLPFELRNYNFCLNRESEKINTEIYKTAKIMPKHSVKQKIIEKTIEAHQEKDEDKAETGLLSRLKKIFT